MTEGYLQVPQVWESEGVESEEESLAGKVEKERSSWRGSVAGYTSEHLDWLHPSVVRQAVDQAAYQAVDRAALLHAVSQAVDQAALLHAVSQAVDHAAHVFQTDGHVALRAVDHAGSLVDVLQVAVVSQAVDHARSLVDVLQVAVVS